MKNYYPHYYGKFSCIGSDCKENCCIGWEIDIDGETLGKYMSMGGALGGELREKIIRSEDGSDCFALGKDGRCPFLSENNLCRLIISGGEDMLCEICRLHPRFRTWFGNRCETGLGLCCEEAARIILSEEEPFSLICGDSEPERLSETEKALLSLRDELWEMIYCAADIGELSAGILKLCAEHDGADYLFPESCSPHTFAAENAELIRSLEPLNEGWEAVCEKMCSYAKSGADFGYEYRFLREYKNLLSYYIFRYFMGAAQDGEIFLKGALAVFAADAVTLMMKSSGMSFAEAACLWSKETEYSEENTESILDMLYGRYVE